MSAHDRSGDRPTLDLYGPHDEAADPDCSGTLCPTCGCCHHCVHSDCVCPDEICGCKG